MLPLVVAGARKSNAAVYHFAQEKLREQREKLGALAGICKFHLIYF